MQLKFKTPPINELVIGIFFNPPLAAMRPEHVGHFWSSVKKNFPNTSHNIPIGGVPDMGFGEIFPMPRFWLHSQDESTLIQIQKNAFLLNWRKKNCDYPHFDNVKSEFDKYYSIFSKFLREIVNIDELYIDKCELSYINIIHQSSFYSGIDDINKIIPSFCILNSDYKTRDFLYKAAYEPFAETAVSVTIQNKLTNDDRKENVLYYEIKAFGKPTSTSKGDADEWFIHAHEAVGKTFLNMTSKEAKEFWGKK